MTKKKAEFGTLVSAKDTGVLNDDSLPGASDTSSVNEISQVGNSLWNYKEEGRINGIPVAPSDLGLMIDREDLLTAAFVMVSTPKSMLLWMTPDDKESQAKYDELLARVSRGEIIVGEETCQYDSAKHAFMVWVKYNEVHYELHKRFEYLRQEVINE